MVATLVPTTLVNTSLWTLSSSNINVGGNTIDIGPQAAVVRGVGLIRSVEDLGNTMLAPNTGFPVLVSDIATVKIGSKPRLGIAGMNNVWSRARCSYLSQHRLLCHLA